MKRRPPHSFVLEALADLEPTTRSMFGAVAVYLGEKIVFILRNNPRETHANGVWIALATADGENLRSEFPNMQPVHILRKDIRGWCLLPARADDFEESALHACDLVLKRDPRIGKVPKGKTHRRGDRQT